MERRNGVGTRFYLPYSTTTFALFEYGFADGFKIPIPTHR